MIRPDGLPEPPWNGSNIVLPPTQFPRAIWNMYHVISFEVVSAPAVRKVLQKHFLATHAQALASSVTKETLLASGLPDTQANRNVLRKTYADMLKEHGLTYQFRHQSYTEKLSILWVAIGKQAEHSGLVSGPDENGILSLKEYGLNWDDISRTAQSVAPSGLYLNYSKYHCLTMFRSPHHRFFNQQMLYNRHLGSPQKRVYP